MLKFLWILFGSYIHFVVYLLCSLCSDMKKLEDAHKGKCLALQDCFSLKHIKTDIAVGLEENTNRTVFRVAMCIFAKALFLLQKEVLA